MGFPRQKYWSGLPFPSPGDLPEPGTEFRSPALEMDSSPTEPPGKTELRVFPIVLGITDHWKKSEVLNFSYIIKQSEIPWKLTNEFCIRQCEEGSKISSAIIFTRGTTLLPPNKNNFKKDFYLTIIFCLIERRKNGKDRGFLPKCHSWKQRSVYFSFVPRGAMQAGASLCLFICLETAHKGKAFPCRAETFVFSFFLVPVELSL